MKVTASNCSDNYGPKRHSVKLIPIIVRKFLTESAIPDHGKTSDLIFYKERTVESDKVFATSKKKYFGIVCETCQIREKHIRNIPEKKRDGGLIGFVKEIREPDWCRAIDGERPELKSVGKRKRIVQASRKRAVEQYMENSD